MEFQTKADDLQPTTYILSTTLVNTSASTTSTTYTSAGREDTSTDLPEKKTHMRKDTHAGR